MANGHGGYRRPSQPAAASGPGALSKRTDGRQPVRELPNAKYGEQQAFQAAQQAAPMSEGRPAGPPPSLGPDLSSIVPMDAPTQRPDEPLTAGLSGGPGAGPTAPQGPQLSQEQADRLRSYLPVLVQLASQPNANPATRQLVRQLRGDLG